MQQSLIHSEQIEVFSMMLENRNLPEYFEALLHERSLGGSAASVECVAVRAVVPPRS